MNKSDRLYFSNFAVDPEFESIYDYDDLYDFDIKENPDQIKDETDFDDTDEFIWDDD
jgi:hypothetical protein